MKITAYSENIGKLPETAKIMDKENPLQKRTYMTSMYNTKTNFTTRVLNPNHSNTELKITHNKGRNEDL